MMRRASLLLVPVMAVACLTTALPKEPPRKTCVVLSVGGSEGLAHLGAMDALREKQIPVNCVVGNSMGALVGSLYVTAPEVNLKERYRAFMAAYRGKTKEAAVGRGVAGGAAGVGAGLLLGGPVGLLALLGALLGASTTPEVSHERFQKALDAFYGHVNIEQIAVPFVTSYQLPRGQGVEPVTAWSGNLAQAVANSAANPLIFPDVSVRNSRPLDPGTDQVSAVPVQAACDSFPGSRLIVINVTGRSSFYSRDLPCVIHEIRVAVRFPKSRAKSAYERGLEAPPEVAAIAGRGEAFEAVYQAGYTAVMAQSSL